MSKNISRKRFIQQAGSALAVSTLGFPSIILPRKQEKLGVALVGLGSYSTGRLAPGLQRTEHCELRGIVTGSPEKIPEWQERHNIPDKNVYSYGTMHEMADNDDIDVAYIVVPTGLHARYAITAAYAGKHVWCEKPMALTVGECQSIIDAANKNDVQLAIGYRMQHEPNTQTIMRFARDETYGAVTGVKTGAGYSGSHPEGNWRRDKELGGGALYDMGVYPINAARYSTQMEPIRARGVQKSDRYEMYDEVDETTTFELEFPGGVMVQGETSFGKSMNYLDVTCEDGWYNLRPFQSYSGVQGETSDGKSLPADPNHQQARQMDNEALAIIEGRDPIVPASEGIKDIQIVQAIMKSSRHDRRWVEL